jgi:purine-binding chemotaxis protein CheW
MSARPKTLEAPAQALRSYLDSLLAEVELPEAPPLPESEIAPAAEAAPTPSVQAPTPAPVPLAETGPAAPDPAPAAQPESRPPPGLELSPALPEETGVRADHALVPLPAVAPSASGAGRPDWGTHPFQCLLFEVEGLQLAVPLVHLNGVLPWPESLTPMPGHQPWFMGLHPHQGVQTKIVDTALLVLPQSHRPPPAAERRFGNIVLIDDGRWGLACREVAEMITVEPDDVRWRSRAGRRPWLAGTVKQQMCALLDVGAFAELLATGQGG